jgi:hypothetical protein
MPAALISARCVLLPISDRAPVRGAAREVAAVGKNGDPKGGPDGDPVLLRPSVWLDQNRSINGIPL